MQQILFHAIRPPIPTREWRNFSGESRVAVKQTKDVVRLSEDVWLISEGDPWMSVVRLVDIAGKYRIACRTFEFERLSEWQDYPHPE